MHKIGDFILYIAILWFALNVLLINMCKWIYFLELYFETYLLAVIKVMFVLTSAIIFVIFDLLKEIMHGTGDFILCITIL